MTIETRQLVDPAFFSRANSIELRARGIVDVFLLGIDRVELTNNEPLEKALLDHRPGRRSGSLAGQGLPGESPLRERSLRRSPRRGV